MRQYLNLLDTVIKKGRRRETGTQGIGNQVYTGYQMRFRPAEEFPLITTKSLKGAWKGIIAELLWFLSGSSKVSDLHKYGVHFWDQWVTKEICDQYGLPEGDLGRIYGPQWRTWRGKEAGQTIDQITNVIQEIKRFPNSKRMMVTSWNPADVDDVMIAPCHGIFKFVVAEGVIDLAVMQRSCDVPVGYPFNMASYSLLLLMTAQVTGLIPGELVHWPVDCHIYDNQLEGVHEQLKRIPRGLPQVRLNPDIKDIFEFGIDDFELVNYLPHPYIKIPVAL